MDDNMPGMPPLPEPKTFQPMYSQPPSIPPGIPPSMPPSMPSSIQPSIQTSMHPSMSTPNLTTQQWSPPSPPSIPPVTPHWFLKLPLQQETWKPFSVEDSLAIESAFERGATDQPISVDGSRYDVMINKREKVPVYWSGQSQSIRRCSWFHRSSPEGRWIPYEEETAEKLERDFEEENFCSWHR